MEQKASYVHYLIIGISSLTMSLSSCQQEIEYRLDTEFVFENQTEKTLLFSVRDPNSTRNEIHLEPYTSDTIKLIPSKGSKNPNPDIAVKGYYIVYWIDRIRELL